MVKKTKLRPRRLFKDKNTNRFYYIIDGKKKYVKVPDKTTDKQIAKINIQNIIPIPVRRKRIRKPSEVKPITNQQIVSKLVPIAPVSSNLSQSRLFKGKEAKTPEEEKKLEEEKKKLEDEKKKSDDEKKKLEDEKKSLEDEKKKLSDEIRRLDDEKRKTEDENRLREIQRQRDILEEERKKLQEDAKNLNNDFNELKKYIKQLNDREDDLEKKEKQLRKREEGITLAERMAQLSRESSPVLSETSSVSSERIPKPSKSGISPALEDIIKSKTKTPQEKVNEFIKTSIEEKQAKKEELNLEPEYVNPEEANEGDIGYEESKEDNTIRESKTEINKPTLKGITKKLKDIVITEYAGNFNYPEFVNWWENSTYGTYKTPTQNQFEKNATDLLPEVEGKSRDELIREARLQYVYSSTATNTGRGAYANDNDGIYNDELQEIFADKTNKFLPVIASDKMDTLLTLVDKDTKKFGWIQNTEPSSSMGRHWVAYFIDIPNLEINYFDSLVENNGEPTKQSLKGLKKIIDKINPEYYLKLKTNLVMLQNNRSSNCGYFALKFLMDRYRNIPFRTATMYDKITGYNSDDDVIEGDGEGEKMIRKFKRYL